MFQKNPENRTLWIGDIEPWMNEKNIEDIFNQFGRVTNVKLVRSKEMTQPPGVGYCFVEFETHAQADSVITKYSQKPIPGTSNTFRMNWSNNRAPGTAPRQTQFYGGYPNQTMQQYPQYMTPGYPGYGGYQGARYGAGGMLAGDNQFYQYPNGGAISNRNQDYQIYIGDLQANVTEPILMEHFKSRFPTVIGAKVVVDPVTKLSKGFGFIKCSGQSEVARAITELNGSVLQGKSIKVTAAAPRSQPQQTSTYGTAAQGAYATAYNQQPATQTYYQQQAGYGYDQAQNAAWLSYQQQQQQYAQYYASTAAGGVAATATTSTAAQSSQPQPSQQVYNPVPSPVSPAAVAGYAIPPAVSTYPPQTQPIPAAYPGYYGKQPYQQQQLPAVQGYQQPQMMAQPGIQAPSAGIPASVMASYNAAISTSKLPTQSTIPIPFNSDQSGSSQFSSQILSNDNITANGVTNGINNHGNSMRDGSAFDQQAVNQDQLYLQQQGVIQQQQQQQQQLFQQQQMQIQHGRYSAVKDQQFKYGESDFLEEDPDHICAVSNLQFTLSHNLQ